MEERYKIGDVVLGNWKLTSALGEGSFGRVFAAEREDFGHIYKSAIKIITIPQSSSEIESAQSSGMDDESVTTYFRSFVEDMVNEFELMDKLKGDSNIVSYEDHSVVEHTGGIGWDIIIRMELLKPLTKCIRQGTMSLRDVMAMGIDMCRALEVCQKFNIIHRDIKPENIFISETGHYKLGDFGVARTAEKMSGSMSKKGTYTYMAPEMYKGEAYGSGVDIYSLGIVLYRLLNGNRAPFLPEQSAIKYDDVEKALAKRMSGSPLPAPKNAEGRLAEIVLKACAYDPKDRYSSPLLMRQELEAILYDKTEAQVIYPAGDEVSLNPAESTADVRGEPAKAAFVPEVKEPSEKTVGLFDGFAEEQDPEDAAVEAAAPDAEEANENAAGLYGCNEEEIPAEQQPAYVKEEPETEMLPEDAPEERTVKTEPPRPAAAPPVPPKAPEKQRRSGWKKAAKNKKTLTAIIIGTAVLVCVAVLVILLDNHILEMNNVSDGQYVISISNNPDAVMDASATTAAKNGALKILRSDGSDWQTFAVVAEENEYVKIYNLRTGRALFGGKTIISTNYNNSDRQLWKITSAGDGSFFIENKYYGTYLCTGNGGLITLADFDQNDQTQKWVFTKVG